MGELADLIVTAVGAARASGDPASIAATLEAIRPDDLEEFFHAHLDLGHDLTPIGEGLPASPGAASGRIVLSADDAIATKERGERAILVRPETTPDDVLGMQSSVGILTMRGGLVSHAAVVARGWGIPAVVGSNDLEIVDDGIVIGTTRLRIGDEITINGTDGSIYVGAHAVSGGAAPSELDQLLEWADAVARGHVEVRANADTAADAAHARRMGAVGIGLCRTEHMFLAADRLPLMRRFILSDDPEVERDVLEQLEQAQEQDFESVLEEMDGLPVTVRLLDPPLHEFLPDLTDLAAAEARGELDEAGAVQLAAARRMHETNPMIGTRGVRLAITRPGLYEMQVRALCTAAVRLFERGRRPHVEIMIPLVVDDDEMRVIRGRVAAILDELGHPELAADIVVIGAMIETPRAAIIAGALAKFADFFSFGTNDLTQMTYAFSRDDVETKLMPAYVECGILDANPFAVLDQDGVGGLVRYAVEGARATKPTIKLGVCGEHAGHPESAAFLIGLGIDSVSCSPYRVPMARLAVARALLATGRVDIGDVDFGEPVVATASTPDVLDTGTDTDTHAALDIDEALVLHVLRVRGFVTADGFEASLGAVPRDFLDALVERGDVRYMEARDMWGPTPAGKERAAELLTNALPDDAAARLTEPYRNFLELNDRFKQLCTDWQIRDGEPNDHSNGDYDARCVSSLAALATESAGTIDELAAALPRLGRYRSRLDAAASAVAAGETKQFTGVMCESFHDIWMELHEDLIVLQGIDRTAEGSF